MQMGRGRWWWRLRPALGATLACALGAVVLSGCAQGQGAEPGALVVYSGQHVQTTEALVAAFERATGIAVSLRSDNENVLADQIVTEGARSPADVFYAENSPPLQYLASKGLLAPVEPATLANTPPRFNSPDGEWVGVSARVSVLVYNTSLLKPGQLPTSALQLADPKWSGRIAIAGSETDFQPVVASIAHTYGDAATLRWLESLKANAGGHAYPDNETVTDRVNRGQVALGLIDQYYWYRHGRHTLGHRLLRTARRRLRDERLGCGCPQVVGAPGRGPALPRLPHLGAGAGDHRPQRQLRVPGGLGGDDGTAPDAVRPAPTEPDHRGRAGHRGRGHPAAAGGPAPVRSVR
jgi:hypothetical protein